MLVKLLIGRRAGEIVDMKYADGLAMIEGRKALRDDGTFTAELEGHQASEHRADAKLKRADKVPAGWRTMPFFSIRKLARELSGKDLTNGPECIAAIEDFLSGTPLAA